MPKVSVIIPTFNCAQYLSGAIESVLRQTYQDFEIIVIDDGSTDNTKEVVAGYLNSFPDKVRYLYQNNQGLACARNAGVRNSKGEYIALLDADDLFMPAKLQECLSDLTNKPGIGLVHTGVLCVNEAGELFKQEPLAKDIEERIKKNLSGRIFKHLFFREAHICASSAVFRKECIDVVGSFDEYLTYLGCEDRDLWLRISEKYEVAYVDSPLVYYRLRGNSMSKDSVKMLKARNYVIEKTCTRNKASLITKRRAYSNLHAEIAYGSLAVDNKLLASIEALKSIGYFPLNIKPYKTLVKVCLGEFGRSILCRKVP